MKKIASLVALAAGVALAASACSSSTTTTTTAADTKVDWATVTNLQAAGGMSALVAAAKAEGHLNAITLPPTWANYGVIMAAFTKQYGIKVNDANPNGSSGDEITAIKNDKTLPSAPDVVDIGLSHAIPNTALFAPYEVSTWADIPAGLKDADGAYYGDYGGYITIACNPAAISGAPCPKTFADLLNPAYTAAYKGKVALDGDPTSANAAFSGVWAAALAEGGSLDNIQPGVTFFQKLKASGEFTDTASTESTIEQGSTPISIDWEFNNSQYASDLKAKGINLQVSVPSDGLYAAYYDQAINKNAPDPAAARLWEEFLYSTAVQNDFMGGFARPVEFAALQTAGTLNSADEANLPTVSGSVQYPSATQLTTAQGIITADWASAVG
jgi:putative spermidine/putrescine transport system substrate-binding protein